MFMIEGHDEISAQMELKSGSLVWAFALQGERPAYQRISYWFFGGSDKIFWALPLKLACQLP